MDSRRYTFSIITPCYNAEKYIVETASSILNNIAVKNNKIDLEYIVIDGNSSDKTVGILNRIFEENQASNIQTKLITENDTGMYDALAKGIRMVNGDFCAYINAGDFYSPGALDIALEIFSRHRSKWITGLIVTYNENSQIIRSSLPFKYRGDLIRKGFYIKALPCIQQESIFWDTSLNSALDLDELSRFKLAGDYYIWKTFSQSAELQIVEAWLGGFKVHKNQLSHDKEKYIEEMNAHVERRSLLDYPLALYDRLMWYAPPRIKKRLNKNSLFTFNHASQRFE